MRVWEGRREARRQRAQRGGRGGIVRTALLVRGAYGVSWMERLTWNVAVVAGDVETRARTFWTWKN